MALFDACGMGRLEFLSACVDDTSGEFGGRGCGIPASGAVPPFDACAMPLSKLSRAYPDYTSGEFGGRGGGISASGAAPLFDACVMPLFALSPIHIPEPTRLGMISYAVFCVKKKKNHAPLSLSFPLLRSFPLSPPSSPP